MIGLLEILELVYDRMFDKSAPFAYEVLYQKYPPKKVDRKFDTLVRRGYLEFGVSARTGWLTGKGMAKLFELRQRRQRIEPIPMHPNDVRKIKEAEK